MIMMMKANKFHFTFVCLCACVCVWPIFALSEMLRMWNPQSTMGVRNIRYLDLFGMLGKTSRPWCAFIVCSLGIDGQMERHRIGKNEGKCAMEVNWWLRGLEPCWMKHMFFKCQRSVGIKGHVNSWIVNQTTMTPCPFSKSTIPRRPLCIVIKSQHWLKVNRGVQKHPVRPITAVAHWMPIHIARRPAHAIPPMVNEIQRPTRIRRAAVAAIKILMMTVDRVATKISIHPSFAIKNNISSIASKKKMHRGQSE